MSAGRDAHGLDTQPTQPGPENAGEAAAGAAGPLDESGDYAIIEPVGRGGMGRVYRAYDTALTRDVAIKFLLEPGDQASYRRFVREARAAARLGHENIAQIHRFGTWSSGARQGQPYLVEEYVPGNNLAQMRTPRAWTDVLTLAPGIAAGLAAAHRAGVLHRDVKPANVIVTPENVPKLVDFGLAQLAPHAHERGDLATSPGRERRGDGSGDAGDAPGGASDDARITSDSALVGTPRYLAPESWRGEPASIRSDIYALGVLLYELCAGRTPFADVPLDRLGQVMQERDAPGLAAVAPSVDKDLAAIIDRCLARDPNERFVSADHLVDALTELAGARGHGGKVPPGEPYRGLLPFESTHHAFFFGRERETRKLVERMRTEPLVLVTGPSGVGKSSLVRAGLCPALERERLDGRLWQTRVLVPGRYPLDRLAAELGRMLDAPERAVAYEMTHDMPALIRRVRGHGNGESAHVLVVDQLEELVTVADAGQAEVFGQVLVALAEEIPAMRVVATVRDDRLAALARMAELRAQIERGRVFFVGPLAAEHLREAIVGPARVKGVRFASGNLVDELVAATEGAPGGLPLLQFALSRIWRQRDVDSAEIPGDALETIGGLERALSQHADRVFEALSSAAQNAARDILVRLVSEQRTRVRYPVREFFARGEHYERALNSLVDERLLVVSEDRDHDSQETVCELAHEALISGWPTLALWLDDAGERRALERRIADAARQWQSEHYSRDLLWRGKILQQAEDQGVVPGDLLPLEQWFLRASHSAARRARWLGRVAVVAAVLAVVGTYTGVKYHERVRVAREVAAAEHRAMPHLLRAGAGHLAFLAARRAMTWLYQQGRADMGELVWQLALALVPEIEDAYDAASRNFEHAWRRDPGHRGVAAHLADLLAGRAHLAHALGQPRARDRLLDRLLDLGDPRDQVWRWRAPVEVVVRTEPPGLPVEACPYQEDGSARADRPCARAPGVTPASMMVPPGSYRFVVERTATTPEVHQAVVLEPMAVSPGKDARRVHIDVPARNSIPEGFAHVPAGRFGFGFRSTAATEALRRWFKTAPLHERATGAYGIARHETTFGEYMAFLRALPADEREQRRPRARDPYSGIELELEQRGSRFILHWQVGAQRISVAEGQRLRYPKRAAHADQDWQRFPVIGISGADARAYVAWLDHGELPGARLCREDEWERAARGADGRAFPHGPALSSEHANIDRTHGWNGGDYGPDEVGSHPDSVSPFGVHDTIGNAWELVESVFEPGKLMLRSGPFFYDESTNALVNRDPITPDQRLPFVGFRVCVDMDAAGVAAPRPAKISQNGGGILRLSAD